MHVTSTREKLAAGLEGLGLGAWQYYPSVGSTNDLALDWAHAGAPDWALVIADAQTAGRGRGDRTWETKPGGLAISLVLRPTTQEIEHLTRFTALAGLGLLVVTIYLARKKINIIYTVIPMIFMVIMTGWAMVMNIGRYYSGANWLLFFIGLIVFVLEIWMIIESIIVLKEVYGKELGLPETVT